MLSILTILVKFLFSRTGIALLSTIFIWGELTFFKIETEILQNKIISLKQQIKQKQATIDNLNSQLKVIQSQLTACYSTYNSYRQTCEQVIRERDSLITKLTKLKTTIYKLEHTNKVLKNQTIKVEVNPSDEVSNVLQFKDFISNNSSTAK